MPCNNVLVGYTTKWYDEVKRKRKIKRKHEREEQFACGRVFHHILK